MNVNQLKEFIYSIANKDQSGNLPTPEQFNLYLARANEDKFRIEYGLREQAGNEKFWQASQNTTDALSKFVVFGALTSVAQGKFSLPANYVHMSSLSWFNGTKRVSVMIINDDEYANLISNPIIPPTNDYPIARFVSYQVWTDPPLPSLDASYLRMPVTPVWGYNIVNDEPVYDPATSVQLEWADIYHIDFAAIILGYMGIQFREQELEQYAIKVQQTGQ